MPQVSRDFEINGPISHVWKVMTDPMSLGNCVPGCEQVTVVNETDSKWKVKMTVGVISRRIEAKAKIIQRVENSQLGIRIESVEGDINGEFHVSLSEKNTPNASSSTAVTFSANIDARGPFQWIVNQVIKTQMDGFVTQFAQCISAKVSAK